MPVTRLNRFLSPALVDSVGTYVDAAAPSSRAGNRETADRAAWQQLIDYALIEWGWDTSPFDDEGIEPPTRDIIQLAIEFAGKLCAEGLPAPSSVVPDANGGIVFERREHPLTEVFHVWDDGTIEYQCFHGTRLTERQFL